MNESTLNRMIREHKARIIWFLVFLILAVFVTALVFGTLKRSVQAQTYTKRVFACSYAQEGAEPVAHQHNDDCYENGELICTLPERELHIHGDECYTEEKVLTCTLEESEGHVHSDACYTEEPVLVCGLEENNGHVHSIENGCYTRVQGDLICTDEDPEHVHTDECYAWEEVLTCEIPEGEGAHHHSEECYETQRVLSCGKEEGEGAHTHDDTCYEIQKVLICDKEEVKTEHVHTVDCFQVVDMSPEEIHALHMSELPESDPDADVESPDVWESRFASVPLSGEWDRDLLKIAETQLGYTESQRNFDAVLDENGEGYTLKGWTRYGAWYGIPYGDWCAMFISFCLNYADIPESAIPYDCATTTWIDSLSARGMYAPAGSYDPKPGDLIFFDWEGDGLSDHVGIVWAVNPGSITTIEGNHTISVELFDYDLSDSHIQGYGILPENPALAVTNSVENSEGNEPGENENQDVAEGEAASTSGTSDSTDPSNNNVDTENTEKTELDPDTLAKMPPFSYSARVAGMRVTIEADAGAFPEETTVTIKPIEDDNLAEKVAPAVSGQVVKVQAVDITFFDAEGNEIEPRIPIRVTMRPFNDTAEADNVEVVHMANDGTVTAVTPDESIAQPDKGAAFDANSFSPYMLVYTVNFAFDKDGNVLEYSFAGGTSVSLRTLLVETGIKSEEEVDDYLSQIVSVVFSKPECLEVTKQGNDWLLKSVHAFDTDEKLTVTLNNGIAFAVPVAVTGIEELQLENASISTVDGVFLPENTEGYANVVEDASAAINAVENHLGGAEGGADPSVAPAQPANSDKEGPSEENAAAEETIIGEDIPVASAVSTQPDDESGSSDVSEEKPASDVAYQVFDIGLEIENMDDFGQAFNVSVNLPEDVAGKDFRLYHIHDDMVEEIPVDLLASDLEGGSQLVKGFNFTTETFSEFVLRYTVDFEYTGEDGKIHAWSFPGQGEYSLQSILKEIGVENAVITDAALDLVEGEIVEGALYLNKDKTALKSDVPFTDIYKLTIVTEQQSYVFHVTDDLTASKYHVMLSFIGESPAITEENDKLYILVKYEHQINQWNKDTRYCFYPIAVEAGRTENIDLDTSTKDWHKSTGSYEATDTPTIQPDDTITFLLLKYKKEGIPNATTVFKHDVNDFIELQNKDYLKGTTIQFKDRTDKDEVITDYIVFKELVATNDYNFLSILGPNVNYGIVAEHLWQQNDLETTFAVHHFTGSANNDWVHPDLHGSSGASGAIVIAQFNYSDGSTIVNSGVHTEGRVRVTGPITGTFAVFVDADSGSEAFTSNETDKGNVDFHSQDIMDACSLIKQPGDQLYNDIVYPALSYGFAISNALKNKITFDPPIPSNANKLTIDTTEFAEDATIYINADRIKEYIGTGDESGRLIINKKTDQMIVFNFNTDEDVNINQFVVIQDQSGFEQGFTTKPEDNEKMDIVARHIVWNLNGVTTGKTRINTSCGIFLQPNEGTEIEIAGTSCGWIVTNGQVYNNGCEWHSVYQDMPDTNTVIIQAKKTIDNKVPGNTQVFRFCLDEYDPSVIPEHWTEIKSANNSAGNIVFDKITYSADVREGWHIYRIREDPIKPEYTNGSYQMDTATVYYVAVYVEIIDQHVIAHPAIYYTSNLDYEALYNVSAAVYPPENRLPNTLPSFNNIPITDTARVKATKTFVNAPEEIYSKFMITASWTKDNTTNTVGLTTTGDDVINLSNGVTVTRTGGTESQPYEWVISNLPNGTWVSFVEKDYGVADGSYKVEVTVNGSAVAAGDTPSATIEAVTSDPANVVSFVNSYTQNSQLVITIKKYDDSKPRKQIGGAVFELWRGDEIVTHDKYDWLDSNNQFTVTDDPDGYTIRGLEDGTYQIKEVHHPDGYVITNEIPVTFTVDEGAIVASTVECKGGATYEYEQVPNPIFSIVNHAGTELPKTGGPGTALYGLLGGLMVVTAGAVLTLRKKKNKA